MKNYLPLIAFILSASLGFSQSLNVTGTFPPAQSLNTAPTEPIVITFDQVVDASTINSNNLMVFGRWSGPMQGEIIVSNTGDAVTFIPDRSFFYGEWISVRLTYDVLSDDGDVLEHGFGYNYWTKTEPGLLNQELQYQIPMRQNGETFIQCYGAYAGDVNDDEYSDLVVVNEDSEDIRILLNDGTGDYDGTFTLYDMPASTKPSTNEASDFNHDGQIDLALGSSQSNKTSVFMGNTTTIFDAELSYTVDEGVRGLSVIDMNGDGWDDIVTANRVGSNISFLMNDGTGFFGSATSIDVGMDGETASGAADLNGDGFIDLVIGGYFSSEIATLINDGTGDFTVQDITAVNGRPWMVALGDVNGDGHVDVASADASSATVSISLGDGNGNMTLDNSYPVGSFPLAIDVGDIDGDGDLDFIASSFSGNNFTLYENNGSGSFSNPITYPSTQAGSCVILHDRNNDGAMDITLIDELADIVFIYDNVPQLGVEDFNELEKVTVYPNPFEEELFLSQPLNGLTQFNLYDLLGRLVFSTSIENETRVDLSGTTIEKGLYIAELENQGKKSFMKLYKKN